MNSTPPSSIIRSLLWSGRDPVSLEHFQLHEGSRDIRLTGTIITTRDGEPLRIEYVVQCDGSWATRAVRITVRHGVTSLDRSLIVDDQRRWWSDGEELAEVAGCIDVDISLTPSTNTLPIRRLSLAVGEERDVVAAWVRFPDLAIEPLPQRYARTGDSLYRYSSGGGTFTADIEVDDAGLVVRYPPLWVRAGLG